MALCEPQLDSHRQLQQEEDSKPETSRSEESNSVQNGIYGNVPPSLPLAVDYRSPISHFIPPVVEMYSQTASQPIINSGPISASPSNSETVRRKRGRPRIDKTSPEYLARHLANKQQREIEAAIRGESGTPRKRGRPRVDKTSPEYQARRRQRELEALERKAKRQNRRRNTGESAGSSEGDSPRVKRKYVRRPGSKPGRPRKETQPGAPVKLKGKRGRPRKNDPNNTNNHHHGTPRIRVRSNLMPNNSTETITIDSDEELGSPSESLSLDENLRALRSIHEKYAHLQNHGANHFTDIPKSSDEPQVEKLEDSSNSDSDSSTGSSSSSSNSSTSSSSSESSSSESEDEVEKSEQSQPADTVAKERRSSNSSLSSLSGGGAPTPESISESENESVDKTYQCHICLKWYSTIVTLKIHRRGHSTRPPGSPRAPRARAPPRYPCLLCPATFNRREKLQIHQSEAHRGSMTLKCESCGRSYEDEEELKELEGSNDERQGRCPSCRSPSSAVPSVTPKPVCTVCGKTFFHPHSLTRHMQNHQRQMYRCVVCKASFARADQLAQHLNSHLANYKRLKP